MPHELRPVPVLKMTMDYLATNIMDLVDGREGEWFDFVWNRTRGIRKVNNTQEIYLFYLFIYPITLINILCNKWETHVAEMYIFCCLFQDITQQHLCDPDCVDLVEKTARYEILT